MNKRRIERIAAVALSSVLLLSSTDILSSFALNTSETSSSVSSSTSVSSLTETTKASVILAGNGTKSSPYIITNADEFISMQAVINSNSADKYFELGADIDLSGVKASALNENGSLISANSDFVLDGDNHTVKGLDLANEGVKSVAIFSTLSKNSTIKNLVLSECNINVKSDNAENVALLVAENNGTINNVTIKASQIKSGNATNIGLVCAVNNSTVTNVSVISNIKNTDKASATSYTIYGCGSVGAVVGSNNGKIVGVSAVDVGIVSADKKVSVVGGIVGTNNATVNDSFATGMIYCEKSTDYIGGIAGKASEKATFNNDYTLVKTEGSATAYAIIGIGGNSDMMKDCYWSSTISNCLIPATACNNGVNDLDSILFKSLEVGESLKFNPNTTWGKATLALTGSCKASGSGIAVAVSGNEVIIKGVKNNTVNYLDYSVEISLPSTVGNSTTVLTQKVSVPVIVGKGKGTAASPFEIENATQLATLSKMTGVYAKLTNDITFSGTAFNFVGSIEGAGHTITVESPIFNTVIGSIKDVNIKLDGAFNSAVFGNGENIKVSGVNICTSVNGKFTAKNSNVGVLLNTICGNSSIENVNIVADVTIAENISGFGAVASVVKDNCTISNSSVKTDISLVDGKKAENVAGFIGTVSSENVTIKNCCIAGTNNADKYLFIANITADNMSISDITVSKTVQPSLDFEKYTFIDRNEFTEWSYDGNNSAFFTGNGGIFEINLPNVTAMLNGDYSVDYNKALIGASVSVDSTKLVLNVTKNNGVITVKASPVTITNKLNGMTITVYVSNGLEKDSNGNYLITNGYDLAYVSENIEELKNSSLVVTKDIDMSELSAYSPIGSTATAFSGKFNGNGYTISGLNMTNGAKCGLFGSVENAEIINIVVKNICVIANGSYSAVLVGHSTNSKIDNITVENSSVDASDIYSGVIVGFISGGSVKNIKLNSNTIKSTANYVGAVAGFADANASISDVEVNKFNTSGAEYVGGVAGLVTNSVEIKEINVNASTLVGTNYVSGIASGTDTASAITDVTVDNCDISTANKEFAFTVGGISACFGGSIRNATVSNSTLTAGTVGGVVAKTVENGNLVIENSNVNEDLITASGLNTIAAGILAVHNINGTVRIVDCKVDEKTKVNYAAISSSIVGEVLGANCQLNIENCSTYATVNGCEDANAVASAGIAGVVGLGAVNCVVIKSVNVLGSINGVSSIGGGIGLLNEAVKYTSDSAIMSDCVISANVYTNNTQSQENCGMVIGSTSSSKCLNEKNIDFALSDIIITTYYPNSIPFGSSMGISSSAVIDMDKPNGKQIESSVEKLTSDKKTEVKISNLPDVDGFEFDAKSGWQSESEDRIQVISSTENTAVLKANHLGDIGIVGYYVSTTDSSIRIPVHFNIKSTVRTPLQGSGTKADPYLIANAYDLETVSTYDSANKYFVLSDDIKFADSDYEFGGAFYNVGNGLVTIGDATNGFNGHFSGLYNGVVHTIYDMKISGNAFGGLFGATDGAEISNLIIDNADISGENYAGVIVGSARNTTISDVIVKNSSVSTSQFGGFTGGLVGYAENVEIKDSTISNSNVSTVENSTSATVEVAGGISAVFDGTIKNCNAENITVNSSSIAGGVIGEVKDGDVDVESINVDATVYADIAGGVVGEIVNLSGVSVSNALVNGTVNGAKSSAGVFAKVDDGFSLSNSTKSLLNDTVVTCQIKGSGDIGEIVGTASEETFDNSENESVAVFDNVYYSSYNNACGLFGSQELNSYQLSEYNAVNLNAVKYSDGLNTFNQIPFNSNVEFGNSNIVLPIDGGDFNEFTVGTHTFTLKSVSGAGEYSNGKLRLNDSDSGKTVRLNYNGGLVLEISIGEKSINGNGISIKYNLIDKTQDSVLSNETAVLFKTELNSITSSFSFFADRNNSNGEIQNIYIGNGGFYVDINLPNGYKSDVTAVDSDGKKLKVKDCDNEGYFVETNDSENVEISVTVSQANSIWGLRSVWNSITK